jgi:hypothetical protein
MAKAVMYKEYKPYKGTNWDFRVYVYENGDVAVVHPEEDGEFHSQFINGDYLQPCGEGTTMYDDEAM